MIAAVAVALVLASEPAWEHLTRTDGVNVYGRAREGSALKEMKGLGVIDAPPDKVWKVIRDYEHMTTQMPYTEEAKVLERQADDKEILFYSVTHLPLVSRRDYVIRLTDESKDGTFKVTWVETKHAKAPAREGFVRTPVNRGMWLLEPREGGKKTFVTYVLVLDPGGSVPDWLANRANALAVPTLFAAVRKAAGVL